ncbi:MAG: translation elongation factor 4, partial [Chlamydiota bacterium]|nr:translation elongation factor 4 [Chlamydiota bacterium]
LERIATAIPPPESNSPDEPLRALVFDSHYDPYRGVMVYLRMITGSITSKLPITLMSNSKRFDVVEVGKFCPKESPRESLKAGETGYLVANIKTMEDLHIGETITTQKGGAEEPLPGFRQIQPVVYAGLYPLEGDSFLQLGEALQKLKLNDASLSIEQEHSAALGMGFRCGFLGLLHLEISCERLRREFAIDLITTSPNVIYHITMSNGETLSVDNPTRYPDPAAIAKIEEPWVEAQIIAPSDYLGAIMSLNGEKRGELITTDTIQGNRLLLTCHLPLNEIFTQFHDQLKSITRGYGSFDYGQKITYRTAPIVKLEIRVNEEPIDPFSCLIHRDKARAKGLAICEKLKEILPRQQFKVPIQAAIGGNIIARETISAVKKNVTAKCYGGDITRKRKLWEKQKKGKKKLQKFGKVPIPQSAFIDILKTGD